MASFIGKSNGRTYKVKSNPNANNMTALEKANQKVHKVETQWHYQIMIDAGFESKTPEQTGFVRNYLYVHPTTGSEIIVTTGSSADYWTDKITRKGGYWESLKPYVNKTESDKVLAERAGVK